MTIVKVCHSHVSIFGMKVQYSTSSLLCSHGTRSKVTAFQNTQFEKSSDGVNEALSIINVILVEAADKSLRKNT